MSEFERDWTHTEREQHARLLYQLKREIVAKRQAEQAQTRLQRTAQPPQRTLIASLPSVATPTETARPSSLVPKLETATNLSRGQAAPGRTSTLD
ncbi:MAG: hypothetical protein KME45_19890 [Stenomitos rutilans HA7619-LM2]|jgi:hypothetical protein|nr:hypothetical protein [Stenomitos rutilans HA7619-LM2]